MRTWPYYIPTITGKKWWIYQKDDSWMDSTDETVPLRKKEEQGRKIKQRDIIYARQLIFEQIANDILTDPHLSQSYWNPPWYPPVPQYTPPKWKRLSTWDVREAKLRIAKRDTVVSENFWDAWVWTSMQPITMDQWELYHEASFPHVSHDKTYTQLQVLKSIQWVTARERYSEPNIVERVKWFVTFLCSEQWSEMLWMYCYRNSTAIAELTGFLADTSVSNESDKNEAIMTLSELYFQTL